MAWYNSSNDFYDTIKKEGGKITEPIKKTVAPLTGSKPTRVTGTNIPRSGQLGFGKLSEVTKGIGKTSVIKQPFIGVSMKDNPKSFFGKVLAGPFDQGLSKIAPNALGNRSAYERITGDRPQGGNYPQSQVTPSSSPQAMNNGQVDPQTGLPVDPNKGPFTAMDVQFPDYTNPAWKAAGVMSQNETEPTTTDAINRRYDLLQGNLKASESALRQQEQDALGRRFASMGASRSGAAQRAESLAGDAGARRFGEQRNALMASQAGDQQAAIEAMNQRNLARDQLRLGSQEQSMAGMTDVAKAKLGNIQFEKELDLNRAISAMNADLAWQIQQQNNQGILGQLTGSLFGNGFNPFLGKSSKNPYLPQIQGGGQQQSSGPINFQTYNPTLYKWNPQKGGVRR